MKCKCASYLDVCYDISPRVFNGPSCRLSSGGTSGVCVLSEAIEATRFCLLKKLNHSSLSYRFSRPHPLSLYSSTGWWRTGRSDNPSDVQWCQTRLDLNRSCAALTEMRNEGDVRWSLRSAKWFLHHKLHQTEKMAKIWRVHLQKQIIFFKKSCFF